MLSLSSSIIIAIVSDCYHRPLLSLVSTIAVHRWWLLPSPMIVLSSPVITVIPCDFLSSLRLLSSSMIAAISPDCSPMIATIPCDCLQCRWLLPLSMIAVILSDCSHRRWLLPLSMIVYDVFVINCFFMKFYIEFFLFYVCDACSGQSLILGSLTQIRIRADRHI